MAATERDLMAEVEQIAKAVRALNRRRDPEAHLSLVQVECVGRMHALNLYDRLASHDRVCVAFTWPGWTKDEPPLWKRP